MTDRPDIRAAVARRLQQRHAAERRFRLYGMVAIGVAMAFLALLLGRIIEQGHSAFVTHSITLDVPIDAARIDPAYPQGANYDQMVATALAARLNADIQNPEVARDLRDLLRRPVLQGRDRPRHAPGPTGPVRPPDRLA
jgi:phosphate transport system permease protein